MDNAITLRAGVQRAYEEVATAPAGPHPFKVGAEFAAALGYPADWLAGQPAEAVAAFTGTSAVSVWAEIPAGARVLDLGCGAGLDSLWAAERAGPAGRVLGADFSPAMLARARAAARAAGAAARFVNAAAERLPLPDGAVDVALVNGLFNLNPARRSVFAELARVVRPGGAVYAAEIILSAPVDAPADPSLSDWFS